MATRVAHTVTSSVAVIESLNPLPAASERTVRQHQPRAGRTLRERRVLSSVVTVVAGVLLAFPLLWMVIASFKTTGEFLRDEYPLTARSVLPTHATTANYRHLFGGLDFGNNLTNTLIASAGQVITASVVSVLAGFVFAQIRIPLRTPLFALCMAGAFIPIEAIIVPLYGITKDLGLVSTYWALFLPFAFNPFGIFLMRQAFRDIPTEIYEAARVDGAGVWRVFTNIGLPNIKPALATLLLIQFIWSWSHFFWPLIVMQDPQKQVAQVAMANFQSAANYNPMYGEMFAAGTVITLPLVAIACLLQRFYVQGMLTSGLK